MTAFRARRSFQGRSFPRALTLVEPPAGGPETPQRILVQNMNQGSGVMIDPILGNHGTVIGGVERQVNDAGSGLSTGSSNCAASDGATGWVSIPHNTSYQVRADDTSIINFSVLFFVQIDTAPAVGQNRVICAKDNHGPGGWSIEIYNDGGTVKLRAYLTGTSGVLWIDGDDGDDSTGVVALTLETAYRIVMTYDGTTASLWVDDGVAVASVAVAGGGLFQNDAGIAIFSYNNGVGCIDGLVDDFALYDGDLDQAEIEALDDAVTIDHNDGGENPPPVEEFSCLVRSGVTTAHADLGTVSSRQSLNDGGATPYDCTGTTVEITWETQSDQSPTPTSGFELTVSHNGACLSGGAVLGNLDPATQWGSIYPDNGGGVAVGIGTGGGASMTILNILVEGFRAHRVWDGGRCKWVSPRPNFITVRGCWFSDIHDDAWENDQIRTLHLIDSLWDGTLSGISTDNNASSVPSGTEIVADGILMRMRPMGIDGGLQGPGLNPGHKEFFKTGRDGNNVPHDITNCVFALQQAANTPSGGGDTQGNPFRRLFVDGTVRTWENNTICWMGSGSYPWTVALTALGLDSETTILTGSTAKDFWADARQDWIDAHPLVPRLGSPHDDGFAIP